MTDVHIGGFGLHTSLGRGVTANVRALAVPPRAPQSRTVELGAEARAVPCYLLADPAMEDVERRFHDALHGVIDEALADAGLSEDSRRSMGLFIGSSSAEMPILEEDYRRALQSSGDALAMERSSSLGNLATSLRACFGIKGPDYSFYTACTASANALWYAANMIRSGRLESALVVGLEFFNRITALGFSGLQLLTNEVMRPFDRRRSGLIPGEACAAIVLSSRSLRDSQWRVLGGANLCDTHSISATNPDGSAVVRVVREALAASGVKARDISAVKMHGTASLLNDEAESAGIRAAFEHSPTLCALKPYLGHTFGACGAAELALFCASVGNGLLPGTFGICAGDSDLQITLNQTPLAQTPGHFMLNYFGFGGSNTSLVLSNVVAASN